MPPLEIAHEAPVECEIDAAVAAVGRTPFGGATGSWSITLGLVVVQELLEAVSTASRATPVMVAGVTNRLWSNQDLVAPIDRVAATMNWPRFRLRTLVFTVAISGLLFGLSRRIFDLYGREALILVLVYLVAVLTLFFSWVLSSVLMAYLIELMIYVIERVLRRRKDS